MEESDEKNNASSLDLTDSFLTTLCHAQDDPGCKDHPLLSRMPNFYIDSCEENEFDQYQFKDSRGNWMTIEGHTDSTGTPARSKEPRLQGGALKPKSSKPKAEIPKQVRDDKQTRTES